MQGEAGRWEAKSKPEEVLEGVLWEVVGWGGPEEVPLQVEWQVEGRREEDFQGEEGVQEEVEREGGKDRKQVEGQVERLAAVRPVEVAREAAVQEGVEKEREGVEDPQEEATLVGVQQEARREAEVEVGRVVL